MEWSECAKSAVFVCGEIGDIVHVKVVATRRVSAVVSFTGKDAGRALRGENCGSLSIPDRWCCWGMLNAINSQQGRMLCQIGVFEGESQVLSTRFVGWSDSVPSSGGSANQFVWDHIYTGRKHEDAFISRQQLVENKR